MHNVVTSDGYILTMHRIRKDGAQPFFLQHGLLDSSAGFVIMGPNISLGEFWVLTDFICSKTYSVVCRNSSFSFSYKFEWFGKY